MKIEIEFFDAKKVRPTESYERLLCIHEYGSISDLPYSVKYDIFNCDDNNTLAQARRHGLEVKYWAYMPEYE